MRVAGTRAIVYGTVVWWTISFLTACGGGYNSPAATTVDNPGPCPTLLVPVITISVIDAVTRQPVTTASGSGSFSDMTTAALVPIDNGLALPFEPKPGLYTVQIRAAGYQDWTRDKILVTLVEPCPATHTFPLIAELVPVK